MVNREVDNNIKKDVAYSEVQNGQEKDGLLQLKTLGSAPMVGIRHLQVVLLSLMISIVYAMRVNMSVTIVAMTDPLASINPDIPTYPGWTQQGTILSSFFWGYIWPQVVAGYVANRFGAKWFIVGAIAVQSVLGLGLPYIAAHFGEIGVMILRAIQGFCQGITSPIEGHLLSRWVPKQERARLAAFAYSSAPSATMTVPIITGIISSGSYGWPMSFYLYGVLGLLWCALYTFFGYNSPAEHPTISEAEKYFIDNSIGRTHDKTHTQIVPWKYILTSLPVWAFFIAQCGFGFGFAILFSQIPTYLKHVMNFHINENGILSSFPYISHLVSMTIFSLVVDIIINRGLLKTTSCRKVFTSISGIVPAIALTMLAFTKSDQSVKAVILIIIAVGGSSAGSVGWGLNYMDLTSKYAGIVLGLSNSVSHIFTIWAPSMVQIFVKDLNDPEQWKIVFFVVSAIYVGTAAFYVIFASGEKQRWDDNQ